MKKFSIEEPCHLAECYMLPATVRLPEVRHLVVSGQYFAIYAAKQSGKALRIVGL